jgi:hypothetical protein
MHFPIQKELFLRNTQAARLKRQSVLSRSDRQYQKDFHAALYR